MLISQIKNQDIQNINKDKSGRLISNVIKNNQKFFFSIIKRMHLQDQDKIQDYLQESAIALQRAFEKFDVEKKNAASFSTYSYHVVANHLFKLRKEEMKVENNEVSIEKFKLSNNENSQGVDYMENKFIIKNKAHKVFDDIINKYDLEKEFTKLTDLDKKIYDAKYNRGIKQKDLYKDLKMDRCQFHVYYYKVFKKKLLAMSKKTGVK